VSLIIENRICVGGRRQFGETGAAI